MAVDPPADNSDPDAEPSIVGVLHSRGYLALLAIAALLGIPLSLIAFGFMAAVHELEHVVWDSLPDALGYDVPPAWWPILSIGVAGVLVGLVVTYLPGNGGHIPANGLDPHPTPPSALPGVILAALASLGLGAVIGPEAPLIALGGGAALLAVRRTRIADNPDASALIAAAGSAAAISTILGNPLIAAVMFLEVIGLARKQVMLAVLPILVASGVGALVFTGMGDWTGLEIGSLAIPDLDPEALELSDLVWTLPIAVVTGLLMWLTFSGGRRVAAQAARRPLLVTTAVGLLAGALAAAYAVITDHSPAEVALSGQATLGTLATDPGAWSTGALAALIVAKTLAYALCLGAFRGGPVFPAVFLGAAIGVLASMVLPDLDPLPALAIGMAAAVAVTRLPVTSVVLVVLVLGDAAKDLMPVIMLATVAAIVFGDWLSRVRPDRSDSEPAAATSGPSQSTP